MATPTRGSESTLKDQLEEEYQRQRATDVVDNLKQYAAGQPVRPTLFRSWLAQTAELQRSAYGVDPPNLKNEWFAEYVRFNTLAAQVELGEFIQCLPWKPWSTKRGRPDPHDRHRAVGELVDVLHFVANLLTVLGVDDSELNERYAEKMEVNRRRQAEAYDGKGTEVPGVAPQHGAY